MPTAATTKRCPRCGEVKPVEAFPLDPSSEHAHRRYGYCRPCKSDYMRERHAAKTADEVQVENLKRKLRGFGLTMADYETALQAQHGRCAICGTTEPGGKMRRFTLDHDHVTGKFRGLLCWTCNVGLGAFSDNPTSLRAAADYIEGSS